jgi:hypothetical protein
MAQHVANVFEAKPIGIQLCWIYIYAYRGQRATAHNDLPHTLNL